MREIRNMLFSLSWRCVRYVDGVLLVRVGSDAALEMVGKDYETATVRKCGGLVVVIGKKNIPIPG